MSYWSPFLKSCQLCPNFSKSVSIRSFSRKQKLTVCDVSICFFFLKKKMSCVRFLLWHLALSECHMARYCHVSVSLRVHCLDFNLVPTYDFLIQFCPHYYFFKIKQYCLSYIWDQIYYLYTCYTHIFLLYNILYFS